jgi:type 2 lantibiotic biosynthesis protein LanM
VPLFTSQVSQRDLFDSRGRRLERFFATAALERVRARLASLCEDDLARQLYCVQGSLAAAAWSEGRRQKAEGCPTSHSKLSSTTPGASGLPSAFCLLPSDQAAQFMAAAARIGHRLAQLAVREAGEASWVAPQRLPDGRWSFGLIGTDLYSGGAGIALFLAYLARATGRASFEELARAAYRSVRRDLRRPDPEMGVGAFAGAPSRLYAALHLSHLWGEPEVLAEALGALRAVRRAVRRDATFDLLGGAAGCILVMLRLHRWRPDPAALAIARHCGDHLLRNAVAESPGKGWLQPWVGTQPLLGLAHGAGGIAWALFELAAATGDRRYHAAAAEALAYERAHFSAERGNWPDFRDWVRPQAGDGGTVFPCAWCHGAPGIGIARLLSMRWEVDPVMADEVAAALRGTLQAGFGRSHCLCHGDLGNAELLLLTAQELHEEIWRHHALRCAQAVLDTEATEGRWRCGEPGLGETPGLMLGLAGIGYALLRIADPVGVPSVLALQGPA